MRRGRPPRPLGVPGKPMLTEISPGRWSARVYVTTGDAPSDLAGWGEPLASVEGAEAGLTRFAPIGATGDQVLVWFTRTADSGEVAVSEISVRP